MANQPEHKVIKGYEGRYKVSADGRVYSVRKDLYMVSSLSKSGYPQVKLFDGASYHPKNVHRLIAETFLAKPEGQVEVNHKDGNKLNNSSDNLEWITKSANTKHAYDNGLRYAAYSVGSEHANAKIIEEDIRDIRMFKEKGMSLNEIARVYPLTKASIWKIVKHRSWSHV